MRQRSQNKATIITTNKNIYNISCPKNTTTTKRNENNKILLMRQNSKSKLSLG